jgi:hypothetical protein
MSSSAIISMAQRAIYPPAPKTSAFVIRGSPAGAMLETCGSAGKGCTFPVIE